MPQFLKSDLNFGLLESLTCCVKVRLTDVATEKLIPFICQTKVGALYPFSIAISVIWFPHPLK